MATRQGEIAKLITRIKRAGWPVERVGTGAYRVTCSDGFPVQIHRTPSDVNHIEHTVRQLNKHGFAEAEEAAEALTEETRKANLSKDRQTGERKAREAAALARAQGPYAAAEVTLDQILAEHPAPIVWNGVRITPTMAAVMMERNSHNRPPGPNEVAYWVRQLRSNRAQHTHQGVAFDTLGRLQDGQTRLAAIVETGITARMMVSAGWPVENFTVIDVGRRRTAAQILKMEGVSYSAAVASAVRMIYLVGSPADGIEGVWGPEMLAHSSDRVGNDIVYEVQQKLDADVLADAVIWANLLRREIHSAVAGVIAALYLIGRKMPPGDERVKNFVEMLLYGPTRRAAGDPVAAVRRQAGGGAVHKMAGPALMALVIKGWNAHMRGETDTKSMQVRTGTKMPAVYAPES